MADGGAIMKRTAKHIANPKLANDPKAPNRWEASA